VIYNLPRKKHAMAYTSCLTFSSPSEFTLATRNNKQSWDGTLEYSTDQNVWTTWDGTTTITSASRETSHILYMRGTGNTKITDGASGQWTFTGSNIACNGNIEMLLDYATAEAGEHPTMERYCYAYMFWDCTSLISAPELPALILTYGCYEDMFCGCTTLTQAPELPAISLSTKCYHSMFGKCTSLVTPPALPATRVYSESYSNMFDGCTSLAIAPELPATTLGTDCYEYMFQNCTSLTEAPVLPATTLTGSCYSYMFAGCTSLLHAPELPATTLNGQCYDHMFDGCSSLTTAPALPATTLSSLCYQFMFGGCSSLTQLPVLPALTLTYGCYNCMFDGCSQIKLSETETGEYTQSYRIPKSGSGTDGTDSLRYMFSRTGGTFTGTPKIRITYYVSNTNTIVS